MNDRIAARMFSRDRRGQMPFSLIAVVLIMVSSLSAVMVADVHEGSDNAILTVQEMERMAELSSVARDDVNDLSFQALLSSCSGETSNESQMADAFWSVLSRSLNVSYPREQAGYRIEINASGLHLAFLWLSLEDDGDGEWEGLFVPAYVSIKGLFQVQVMTSGGNLTRDYAPSVDVKVPWPMLNDRMQVFDSSISDGLGDLNGLTMSMLDSLAIYRTLQGWGTVTASEGQGMEGLLTESDVMNALDLGLVILQYETFRNATPCMDIITERMDGSAAWEFIYDIMEVGGTIDPVDVFLGLYGYEELDWRKVFSQTIYAGMDRMVLRWMEHVHIIDVINLAEGLGDAIICSVNDLIDQVAATDLIEEQFKDWLQQKFETAGLPDTLYRYLGAGGPENNLQVRERTLELLDADGQAVLVTAQGRVDLDFPLVDVLDWSGWGEFKEQYKRGTNEILGSMRQSLSVMAESISRNMFVPTVRMALDPHDGVSFLDEVRSALTPALERKDEWLRPAISAAEEQVSTTDPLAEATRSIFLQERDEILDRKGSLSMVVSSVAEQIMAGIQASNSDKNLPWGENVMLIESFILNDEDWKMMQDIVGTYDGMVSSISDNFLQGLNHRSVIDGHADSFLADIIAKTGDPMVGLGASIEGEVDQLLKEISHGQNLRGDVTEVCLSKEDSFTLVDEAGRSFRESLGVQLEYPSSDQIGQGMMIVLTDPRSFSGEEGRYPQLHDTDLIKMKWASFQSVWGLGCTGQVKVKISPGGEAGITLPLNIERTVPIDLSQTISVLTSQPLNGVDYHNINTLCQNLGRAVSEVLRPLLEGIEIISSGLQGAYRILVDTVDRLLAMGTKVLDMFSELMQELVVKIQNFVREVVLGPKARLVEAASNAMGEQVFKLSVFGICMTIRTNPKEIGLQEVGVPVSFSLGLKAGGCSIDVTTRLIKGTSDFGILTNASLGGDDWSVYLVFDPFMDVFQHMVEVRGMMNGCCIEMSMPEIVSYKLIKLALSDIPGVGAILSSIPLPIPGLKGSVDAGLYLKLLDVRTDTVVINEYELNPAGEDEGQEWVELFNPTAQAVSLAGWSLQTTHGIQALGVLGPMVLMPYGRSVYQFQGQALDNLGQGFPAEESIVLRDSEGRRVDSTPFATDYWNDGRTWQRAQDGADRWEFKAGTKGYSNGRDPLTRLDLTRLQEAFASAVLESMDQLASSAPSMGSLAETLCATAVHLVQRLSSDLLDQEVEIGLFVEVSTTDYSSSAKVGLRMDISLRCGTLGEMLDILGRSARALTQGFGNPFHTASLELPTGKDAWIGISTFASIGLPKMVALPGVSLGVQYVNSLEANLATLSIMFGEVGEGWEVQGGAAICGVPASSMSNLGLPSDSLVDLWLCKATLHEALP